MHAPENTRTKGKGARHSPGPSSPAHMLYCTSTVMLLV